MKIRNSLQSRQWQFNLREPQFLTAQELRSQKDMLFRIDPAAATDCIIRYNFLDLVTRVTVTMFGIFKILYHFIQFVSHASRALKNRRNVTMVTVILAK